MQVCRDKLKRDAAGINKIADVTSGEGGCRKETAISSDPDCFSYSITHALLIPLPANHHL